MICYRTVDVSAAVAPVGTHSLKFTRFIASVVVVDSSRSYKRRIAAGLWPSESMPCKLDGILHFKSNSSPEAVLYLGFYPYPEFV